MAHIITKRGYCQFMQIIRKTVSFLKKRGVFLIVILVTASAIRTSLQISRHEDDVAAVGKKLAQEQAERARLEEIKNGLNSPEFIEKEARDKLGLAKPGEVVVVLPPEDVLRRLAPINSEEEESVGEAGWPVWRQWVRLFLPDLEKSLPKD